jgi:chemotaxis protein CheC
MLDSFEHDLLLEVASIAAGKTIKPITNVTGLTVSISSIQLVLEKMENIADTMGNPDDQKTVVFIRIVGESNGAVVFLVNPSDVDSLLSSVEKNIRPSALEEVANIISGSSLGGLSRFLNIRLAQSIPQQKTDMLRAVINEIVTNIGLTNSQILCFAVNLKAGPSQIPISVYLLFDDTTSKLILESGKKQIHQNVITN